jgi:hypothetical protein
LELSVEHSKFLVLLLQAEQVFACVVNTVRVAISAFQYTEDVRVVRQLALSFQDKGEDLGVCLSFQSVGNIGHSFAGSGEAVSVGLHLLIDLGLKPAEILAISIKDCWVRESFRKAGSGGR